MNWSLPMIRKAFVMELNPGKAAEYKRRHDEIWPELFALLKSHGVHNYSIYLCPHTHQLFAYAEIESEARWNAIAQAPICRKWWVYMADIMATNSDSSPRVVDLTEMFHMA